LVIIWLKRCLARSLIDPPLESEPVGVGVGLGEGEGFGVGVDVGVDVGLDVGHGRSSQDACADAGLVCIGINISENAAVSAADKMKLQMNFTTLSARTACRWDRH
jgi:hypothetical protein